MLIAHVFRLFIKCTVWSTTNHFLLSGSVIALIISNILMFIYGVDFIGMLGLGLAS